MIYLRSLSKTFTLAFSDYDGLVAKKKEHAPLLNMSSPGWLCSLASTTSFVQDHARRKKGTKGDWSIESRSSDGTMTVHTS